MDRIYNRKMDITGNKYSKLLVESFLKMDDKGEQYYNCVCDCGNASIVAMQHLKRGHTKSCGKCKQTTHPLYNTWYHLKNRCNNPKTINYHLYGGRGITVCDEWNNSFTTFLEDMGNKPTKQHSVERRNNELGYCKSNCYWDTKEEQQNNMRSNKLITYNNETYTISQWADVLNIEMPTLYSRLKNNWTIERAFTEPVIKRNKKSILYEL